MLVLLPPSEGKATRRRGRPVDLDALSFPELTTTRTRVLEALAEVSGRDDAAHLLGVGDAVAGDVRANTAWRTAPALAVRDLYAGVLYDALDLAGMPAGPRRRATARVLVVSAAYGLLRPGDRVAPYRLSMSAALPGTGPLAALWRRELGTVLPAVAGDGLVVDCRSSTYAAAWRPDAHLAERTVAVRVLREEDGRRTVVSHMAKHTRGLVTRHLLTRTGRDPGTPRALHRAVGEAFHAELVPPPRRGAAWTLDVVVPA